jgi:hypothetical protein
MELARRYQEPPASVVKPMMGLKNRIFQAIIARSRKMDCIL